MTDWLSIGSSPPDENCAQVGAHDYMMQARRECRAYIHLLRRVIGVEPLGARLTIRRDDHDFGPYLTVVCEFDDANQAAIDYAYHCESDGPQLWDQRAKDELNNRETEAGHGRMD